MIARSWWGATSEADASSYLDYLHATGITSCRSTPGNQGVQVLRRIANGRAEFLFVSFWVSKEAIQRFAGADIERAVFYPEDDRYLVDRERQVRHYDVVFQSEGS